MDFVVGREKETQLLEQFYQSKSSEFLALYGRRRVGKTFLIREFFKAKKESIFFNATGAKKRTYERTNQTYNGTD